MKFATYASWWIRQAMMRARDTGQATAPTRRLRGGAETQVFEDVTARVHAQTLSEALGELGERQRLLLELRFGLGGGEPKTIQAVADELALTRERTRRPEAAVLRRLAAQKEPLALCKAA